MIEAIILAGGFGTRLRSVVSDRPKPMADIAGRPFLEILLGVLAKKGVTRVVFSLGYMSDLIRSYFGERYQNIDIAYAIEEVPLGTGGGIRLALSKAVSDHVYVFNGDTFLDLDIAAVERQWYERRRPIIVGRVVSDTSRYGRLLAKNQQVVGFEPKGISGPGLINAGCYVLRADELNAFEPNRPFSLEADYLTSAIRESTFDVYVSDGYFIDIGIPDDYVRAQTELAAF